MKITKQYLKLLIKEEMNRVMQEMHSSGPSLDHVERGPLAPDAKPEYVGEAGSYYVYKFGYLFGAYKAAPEHNFYGVFWKDDVDDKSKKIPEPPQKYMIKDFGDEKAKQLAMDYASGKPQPQPVRSPKDRGWAKEKTYGGG